MHKISLLLLSMCFCFTLSANNSSQLIKSQASDKNIYQSKLECNDTLTAGTFQHCWLTLYDSQNLIEDMNIFIEGGMPQHQHGLPTSPKVVWSKIDKKYLIKGLKFSMPGQWKLKFKVNNKDPKLKDQISMLLEVN